MRLRVRRGSDERELKFKLGSKQEIEFAVRDVEHLSPEQKTRRKEWIRGETRGAAHP